MAKRLIDREAEIDRLSVESMRDRLKLAEELCVLFGWSAVRRDESPRDRLAFEAWRRWYDYVGEERGGPKANKRINDWVTYAERRS